MMRLLGSLLAGLSATLLMEHASAYVYEHQSEETRELEEQLRPEMPTTALVRKAAGVIDLELRDDHAARLGTAVHYAFGAVGGTTAVLLSDRTESPLRAGLTVATAMELGVDQGANTVLRLTAPSWRFPLVTQCRAAAAHAVYGVALGLLLAGGQKS